MGWYLSHFKGSSRSQACEYCKSFTGSSINCDSLTATCPGSTNGGPYAPSQPVLGGLSPITWTSWGPATGSGRRDCFDRCIEFAKDVGQWPNIAKIFCKDLCNAALSGGCDKLEQFCMRQMEKWKREICELAWGTGGCPGKIGSGMRD